MWLLVVEIVPILVVEGFIEGDVVVAGDDDLEFEVGLGEPVESFGEFRDGALIGEVTGVDQYVAGWEGWVGVVAVGYADYAGAVEEGWSCTSGRG